MCMPLSIAICWLMTLVVTFWLMTLVVTYDNSSAIRSCLAASRAKAKFSRAKRISSNSFQSSSISGSNPMTSPRSYRSEFTGSRTGNSPNIGKASSLLTRSAIMGSIFWSARGKSNHLAIPHLTADLQSTTRETLLQPSHTMSQLYTCHTNWIPSWI